MQGRGQLVLQADSFGALAEAGQHQPHHRQFFVKGGCPQLRHCDGLPLTRENVLHMIDALVFVIQLQIVGEILGNAGQLDILAHHFPIHLEV